MATLAHRLAASFARHADRPCVRVDGRDHSYAAVFAMARDLASAMNRADPRGAPIAVLGRSLAAYVGVLAGLLSGRTYVPVNPRFPLARQINIATRSRAGFLLADDDAAAAALIEAVPALVQVEAGPAETDGADTAPPLLAAPSPIAYVMFTSGTTGDPKGVMVTTDNLLAYVDAFAGIAPVLPTDRCSQLFDLSFDLSVHDLLVTFLSGAALVVGDERDAIDPVGFAARERLSCWFSVPSVAAMAKRFRRLRPGALPDLRLALFCGEALPAGLARDWIAAAPAARTINVYGPTEATIAITAYEVDAALPVDEPVVPIGRAYPGSDTIVVDANGEALADGTIGELLLGGPQVTAGYLDNPATTAERFLDRHFAGHAATRWYRSGDLALVHPVHGLLYRGRIDDQVKIRGYRIEIAEIEEHARHGLDGEVAIVAVLAPGAGDEQALAGAIVGSAEAVAPLIEHIRAGLPDYMVPTEFVILDALPLNANGKVDRNAIRQAVLDARVARR